MPPSTISIREYFVFGIRVFLGFIFVLSGAFQFTDLSFLGPSALQLEIFPQSWLQSGSILWGFGEILAGIWLILGIWVKSVSVVIGGLLLVSICSCLPALFGHIETAYQSISIFFLTDISIFLITVLLLLPQRHRLTVIDIFVSVEEH